MDSKVGNELEKSNYNRVLEALKLYNDLKVVRKTFAIKSRTEKNTKAQINMTFVQ